MAICGSIFSNTLASELRRVPATTRLPPGFSAAAAEDNPRLLNRLPPAAHIHVVHAYATAVDRIFLFTAPVAGAAFLLSWFLREVPLRRTVGAPDLAEGLGAKSGERSSVGEIERALLRLADGDMRRRGYERIAELSGLGLPGGCCWILARLAKHGSISGPALGKEAGVTVEHGRPYVDRLVEREESGPAPDRDLTAPVPDSGWSAGRRGEHGQRCRQDPDAQGRAGRQGSGERQRLAVRRDREEAVQGERHVGIALHADLRERDVRAIVDLGEAADERELRGVPHQDQV